MTFLNEKQESLESREPLTFVFDKILGNQSTQAEVYDYAAKDIVESVLAGFNGTILAYGQTCSGKTHTMIGDLTSEDQKGIVPRSMVHVFDRISSINFGEKKIEFSIKASAIEIYNENIGDLLACPSNASKQSRKRKG